MIPGAVKFLIVYREPEIFSSGFCRVALWFLLVAAVVSYSEHTKYVRFTVSVLVLYT